MCATCKHVHDAKQEIYITNLENMFEEKIHIVNAAIEDGVPLEVILYFIEKCVTQINTLQMAIQNQRTSEVEDMSLVQAILISDPHQIRHKVYGRNILFVALLFSEIRI